jgi:hypothetical protein
VTDQLTEIVKEMDSRRTEDANVTAVVFMPQWATRILAFWTPERQSFVEAAMEWNVLREEMRTFQHPTDHVREWTNLSVRHLTAERSFRAAYRAMIEAEKGEK